MNAFQTGDLVVSRTNAQGLTEGEVYAVAEVHAQHLPFGTFVTYVLEDDDEKQFAVSNGHLLLDRVAA